MNPEKHLDLIRAAREIQAEEAKDADAEFSDGRDWSQFHTPRQLASALTIEANELQEEFLWKGSDEIEDDLGTNEGKNAVREEIGDVLIYALMFCERTGIDPLQAIAEKLKKNAEKYPAEEVRGKARP